MSVLRDTCFNCFSGACPDGSSLKACPRCHIVLYCSFGCQRLNAATHKPICKFTTSVLPNFLASPHGYERRDVEAGLQRFFDDHVHTLERIMLQMLQPSTPQRIENFLWVSLKADVSSPSRPSFEIASTRTLPVAALDGLPEVIVGGRSFFKEEIRRTLTRREALRARGEDLMIVVVASNRFCGLLTSYSEVEAVTVV